MSAFSRELVLPSEVASLGTHKSISYRNLCRQMCQILPLYNCKSLKTKCLKVTRNRLYLEVSSLETIVKISYYCHHSRDCNCVQDLWNQSTTILSCLMKYRWTLEIHTFLMLYFRRICLILRSKCASIANRAPPPTSVLLIVSRGVKCCFNNAIAQHITQRILGKAAPKLGRIQHTLATQGISFVLQQAKLIRLLVHLYK